jgi:dTDP-3-amino-3,4,6-trideoxy-alpha-D-glucopyranose N,N-dimethyltransferase
MSSYDSKASWYDALYAGAGKDYHDEATALLGVVAELGITPSTLLDVACGTGRHLQAFAETVAEVEGLDLAPGMLELAKTRLPEVPLRHGDMRSFDLGRTFDVVTCLFSAIGHVRDASDLDAAIQHMAAHVEPGGVLLLEPWLTPDGVIEGGHRGLVHATTDDGVVSRASRSVLRGEVLLVEFAWAVSTREGVASATESFRMPLFTRERYLEAFERAGLVPVWRELAELRAQRGLLIGRKPGLAA